MAVLAQSRTAALPRAWVPNEDSEYLPRSAALASLCKPLLISGVLTAVAVPAAQWYTLGPVPNFASLWLENWLVAWAVAAPVVYLLTPFLARVARFVSSPVRREDKRGAGLAVTDIVAVSARTTQRHGFTVLRNLKVREDFYHA